MITVSCSTPFNDSMVSIIAVYIQNQNNDDWNDNRKNNFSIYWSKSGIQLLNSGFVMPNLFRLDIAKTK